jgi:hypothetical protein
MRDGRGACRPDVTLVAPVGFAHRLKAEAYARGAMLAGVARLGPMETARAYDDWIANGYAGEMAYLERGAEKRRDSTLPVPGAVSALGRTGLPRNWASRCRGRRTRIRGRFWSGIWGVGRGSDGSGKTRC